MEKINKSVDKNLTFKFFDSKWFRVPDWAEATEKIYREWYLIRYGFLSPDHLRDFLKNKKSILDAGCGLGRDSKFFAELNSNLKITSVDQSYYAIDVAKKTLKSYPNCEVLWGDITELSLSEKFDFISCDQVIHHTPDPNHTLKVLMSHLNPNGTIHFSVCRKKNKYREFVDDILMDYARDMTPDELWKFSHTVTQFGKALYDLQRGRVNFEGEEYLNIQRFIHDNVFRCWYSPDVDFNLSVSSNYDWFSSNPRFNEEDVREKILVGLPPYKEVRFYQDKATISVVLQKL
jgi:2-polyprenyl-3-methyl-5-hydroxy-6-metoxy-1,4-benzoquinol methylase